MPDGWWDQCEGALSGARSGGIPGSAAGSPPMSKGWSFFCTFYNDHGSVWRLPWGSLPASKLPDLERVGTIFQVLQGTLKIVCVIRSFGSVFRQPNICTFRTPGLRQVKAQRGGNSGDYFQVLQCRTGADPSPQLFENRWPAILCPSLGGVIETCCSARLQRRFDALPETDTGWLKMQIFGCRGN